MGRQSVSPPSDALVGGDGSNSGSKCPLNDLITIGPNQRYAG